MKFLITTITINSYKKKKITQVKDKVNLTTQILKSS
ncbi:hypothetical protein BVRB_000310 [Beta vulgaris subsp. vulgaris]|uniref:Uncharacterized protein n=1 Tax=Beta vulgaris subsp. vulgaris TaxID=3555 RepID=A0A0J8B8Z9_BETVV|nr:hypothetical protein BVRB_000310 [Beta vulgaris subsp. vulgaris]